MARIVCDPNRDYVTENCSICITYGAGNTRFVSYNDRYKCTTCVNGKIYTIPTKDACTKCTEITNEEVIINPSNGVINVKRRAFFTPKTENENDNDQTVDKCFECSISNAGEAVWTYKCKPTEECQNGKCVETENCLPGCDECEFCKCKTWKDWKGGTCIKWRCVRKNECSLPGWGCLKNSLGVDVGCGCILVDWAPTVEVDMKSCPKSHPKVIPIIDKGNGVETGCKCICDTKPEECTSQNLIFDASTCSCKDKCDPDCFVALCEDCVTVGDPRRGKFECKDRCIPPSKCGDDGKCYDPAGGPVPLSLDFIP